MLHVCVVFSIQNRVSQKETHRKRTDGCWGEGIVREFGKVMYTLLHSKWITSKDLLYSTGNPAQCCANLDGRRDLGENGSMYMYG